MRRITLTLLLVYLMATASAQKKISPLLVGASHCLAVKGFLPPSDAGKLTFGYFLDKKSYFPDKEMYVVAFASPRRSNGTVFAIVLTVKDGHESFNIQNNADFVLSKEEPIGVSFVTPPLGGDWTQERLASAIREIEKQPRSTISTRDVHAIDSSVSCEAYTDPQPKPSTK